MVSGKIEFLVCQLLKNYCHVGYNSSLANSNSSGYFLGNYYGVTIINVYKTFIFIRNALLIIKNILFLGGNVLFILNIKKPKKLRFKFFNVKFMYSKYIPGVISNFRSIKRTRKSRRQRWFIRFPSFILINSINSNVLKQEKIKLLPVFYFNFIDTIFNIYNFEFCTLWNNKSNIAGLYFYTIILKFIVKIYNYKAIRFFSFIKSNISKILIKRISSLSNKIFQISKNTNNLLIKKKYNKYKKIIKFPMRKNNSNINKISYKKKNYILKKKVNLLDAQKFGRFKKKTFKKKIDSLFINKSKTYLKFKKVIPFTKKSNINLNIKKNVYIHSNSSLMSKFFSYLPQKRKMVFFPIYKNVGGIRKRSNFYRKLESDLYRY